MTAGPTYPPILFSAGLVGAPIRLLRHDRLDSIPRQHASAEKRVGDPLNALPVAPHEPSCLSPQPRFEAIRIAPWFSILQQQRDLPLVVVVVALVTLSAENFKLCLSPRHARNDGSAKGGSGIAEVLPVFPILDGLPRVTDDYVPDGIAVRLNRHMAARQPENASDDGVAGLVIGGRLKSASRAPSHHEITKPPR
jgi:hypothetical protein